jgi:hypothetical protein
MDGADVEADVFLMRRAEQVNHHAEARCAVLPVDAAEVGEEVKALGVAKEADGFEEVFARDLVGRHVLGGEDLRARKTVG